MKNALFVFIATLVSFAGLAHAQKPADLPECADIVKQCEAAGFKPGEHKKNGKGLWIDCVRARAHDKAVAGVSATKDEARACAQAAKAQRKK